VLSALLAGLGLGGARWRRILPVQPARRLPASGPPLALVVERLRASGAEVLDRGAALRAPLAALARAGLDALPWVAVEPGGVSVTLLTAPVHADDRLVALAANVLALEGLGPRIHDVVEVPLGDTVHTAFLAERIDGRAATPAEWRAVAGRLRDLSDRGPLHLRRRPPAPGPAGPPAGALDGAAVPAGARATRDGRILYVDFHDFTARRYPAFLEALAREAAQDTHFGNLDRRGHRYLYQSIPGLPVHAKRRVEGRARLLAALMAEVSVSVAGRLVLDVGCNLGMMMAQYLAAGARWCHGWDLPAITRHTERLLLGVGCTRFSTTGAELSADRRLEADVPPALIPHLEGCVVSYLAIRGHVGWLRSLSHLPWAFLVYEGHKGEDEARLRAELAALRRLVAFEPGPIRPYRDPGSRPRLMTILRRAASG
jgi:hypothetical protein